MRLLLDTNIVIRLWQTDRQIDKQTRRMIESAAAVYVSAASIWEIVIKGSSRKLDVDTGSLESALLEAGVKPLSVT
jgi:PIN domain nuclease of toxin-antitoxin system